MATKHPNADNPNSAECSCGFSVASADPEDNKARLTEHQKEAHKKEPTKK